MQTIIFTNDITTRLESLVDSMSPASVHIITDTTVGRVVVPRLGLKWSHIITVPDGDRAKNLDSLAAIWRDLSEGGATRGSLVINIGGGVVTDMGGFAAATFKRGIRFINLPTTLLAAVDAAVGGKTGINFGGLKNEIGAFAPADAVLISTATFDTLPEREITSGYAEMMKHALLSGPAETAGTLSFDPVEGDRTHLLALLETSVRVKERIVEADPLEKGLRRALNLGHTVGHAFESLSLAKGTPLPHGHAVATGMGVELILSRILSGFPSETLHQYIDTLKRLGYPRGFFTCDDYPALIDLMRHDKKNRTPGAINFTLLSAPGRPRIDCTASEDDILAALDIYREMTD